MKITAVETVHVESFGNILWVRVHTDDGLVGTGETFRNAKATAAYVHETCAPYLLGKDPRRIERHHHALMHEIGNHFDGFPTRSVELRGNSALDLALWDILGQALGQPLYQLLGGLTRERIRIYNTCAGSSYNVQARTDYNTRLITPDQRPDTGIDELDDLDAQHHRPAELARSLLAEGITAMKIWPFDAHALDSKGHHITPAALARALRPIEQIREAVGDAMDILLEYHGLWRLPAALQIADALDPFDIYWHEDPILLSNFDDLARYKESVRGRVTGSESLGTRPWYREMFMRGAIDVAHFDIGWIGGLTEGKRIATLADSFDRPIAPHDCTGPVQLVANMHLMLACPNTLIAETVRAYTRGFYRDILTALPPIENGFMGALHAPGLGTALQPDLLRREDCHMVKSTA